MALTSEQDAGTIRRASQIKPGWWVLTHHAYSPATDSTEPGPTWRKVDTSTDYEQNARPMRSFTFTDGTSWSTPKTSDVRACNLAEAARAGLTEQPGPATDREQLEEALGILAAIGDAISPTGERPEEALGTLARDVRALVEQRDALADALPRPAVERYADQLRRDADKETDDGVAVGLLRAADGLTDMLAAGHDAPVAGVPAAAPRPATVEHFAAQHLTRRILVAADRVDDLAETIRRYADDVAKVDGSAGRPDYATVAARVVNDVGTALMNLSLGSLSTEAIVADTARIKGE